MDPLQPHYFKEIFIFLVLHFFSYQHQPEAFIITWHLKAFYHIMTFIATSGFMFIINSFFNDGTQAPDLANYVFTTRAIKQIKIKVLHRLHYRSQMNFKSPSKLLACTLRLTVSVWFVLLDSNKPLECAVMCHNKYVGLNLQHFAGNRSANQITHLCKNYINSGQWTFRTRFSESCKLCYISGDCFDRAVAASGSGMR